MSPGTSPPSNTYVLIPINLIYGWWAWRSQMAVSVCYCIWVTLPTIIQPSFNTHEFTLWVTHFWRWVHFPPGLPAKTWMPSYSFLQLEVTVAVHDLKKRNSPSEYRYLQTEGRWKSRCVKVQLLRPQDFLSQRCWVYESRLLPISQHPRDWQSRAPPPPTRPFAGSWKPNRYL